VAVFLQREDGEKVGGVQPDVNFPLPERAAGFHVGDIEDVLVRAAGEADRQCLAHRGMRAVAAGNIACLAGLGHSIRTTQACEHMARFLLQAQESRFALDLDPGVRQSIDQQPFVLVLRVDQRIGKWTDPGAHGAQYGMRHLLAGDPKIHREHGSPAIDHGVGETDLPIQLERTRLDGQCARRRSGFRGLVDDPHVDAQPRQPQGQHQPCRAGTDDQYVGVGCRGCTHGVLRDTPRVGVPAATSTPARLSCRRRLPGRSCFSVQPSFAPA
jgi:hypothetical protein